MTKLTKEQKKELLDNSYYLKNIDLQRIFGFSYYKAKEVLDATITDTSLYKDRAYKEKVLKYIRERERGITK